MTEIEKLIKKRGSAKAKLTIFGNFISKLEVQFPTKVIENDTIIQELEARSERFQNVLDEFEDVQQQIDELSEETDREIQLQHRESFESNFYNVLSKAKILLAKNAPVFNHSGSAHSVTSHGSDQSHANTGTVGGLKLPPIELKTYNGEYDKWIEFRDTFDSLINSNETLSNIQKFHYLRAFIGPPVSEIIASLEFSSDNYEIAWNLICDRYNNNKILIQNHVKSLFNLDRVEQESSASLRKLTDNLSKHLRALNSLKEPTDSWDTLIIYLLCTKLDGITLREWEREKASIDSVTLGKMMCFLKNRSDLLESLEFNREQYHTEKKSHFKDKKSFYKKETVETQSFYSSQPICSFCKQNHFIQDCFDFSRLSIKERNDEAMKKRLCFNCLRSGHRIRQCVSSSCKTCGARHHTMLHGGGDKPATTQEISNSSMTAAMTTPTREGDNIRDVSQSPHNRDASQDNINLTSRIITNSEQVLLSTVSVRVYDSNNKPHVVRALLDVGSQSSFITQNLFEKLKTFQTPVDLRVSGLNDTQSKITGKTIVHIQSQVNNFSLKLPCLIVPCITGNMPNFKINIKGIDIPSNIKLADPQFYASKAIDMLLGAGCFWELMCVGQLKLGSTGPFLQKTKFGWIVSGRITSDSSRAIQCNLVRTTDIDNQLKRFWEVKEFINKKPLSIEEKLCEEHFLETFKRENDGHFLVTIPLKDDVGKLGGSYNAAEKRLLNLERRFDRDESFKIKYHKFINEYRDLKHMTKVSEPDLEEHTYYMPHHGVLKESSLTTKLRVVFDASCQSSTGYSFNDLQLVGPTVQSDLFSVILRFRQHSFVVGADVEKMYRMCRVAKEQRPFQRILWRDEPNDPIDVYELNTVTYGTSAAAFLAIRCLYQLGVECESELPQISNIIKNHFYVDDLLTGAESVEELTFVANETSKILSTAGFHLRKWVSNSFEVLRGINTSDQKDTIDLGLSENTKTLGMIWNGSRDKFSYNIGINFSKRITKRQVLSEISQVFDPIGLLSPCIISAKIILRDIWLEKLEWDDSLSQVLQTKWLNLRDELCILNRLRIPRQVTCKDITRAELHGFCDASSQAYGACVYLKSWNKNGKIFINLICAKSKVAPLKIQTVPRLELTAALLLGRLVDKVRISLDLIFDKVTYWTDSTIVLGWLSMPSSTLQVFVANRVSLVQELSDVTCWRHVPTTDNPADHVSRGVLPNLLLSLDIYWNGPEWLKNSEESWPEPRRVSRDLPELRKNIISLNSSLNNDKIVDFDRFSNLTKLERVTAYCFRFIKNCSKSKEGRNFGPLTTQEIKHASVYLIKLSQQQSFSKEIADIKTGKQGKRSKLLRFNPFLDVDQILRVGGRLSNSDFDYTKKHPIVLCSKNRYTKLLFHREHLRLLHAGPQLLLSTIRDKFWPLSGRNLARKTFHDCVRCFKTNPKPTFPIMGDLPTKRVVPAPPFYTTGVDYAGPFLVKDRKGRGSKLSKAYISIFICFVTKAVHLELVSDLTKEAFLASLRRFISRRGLPSQMYSDNGTNFVSANLELQRFATFLRENAEALTEFIVGEGISWSFIPAHSPHFGGLWEAGVKSTKTHLKRVAGNASLTYEQMYTLLVQIEAVLNSRPLSPLSNDPSDLTPLTPAHFLIGRPMMSVIDPDFVDTAENRLSHFQQIQRLQQHFWARWSCEYVSELQQRCKWKENQRSLQLNDLVVIKEDNQPPLKWMLGRLIELHRGNDNIARVASVKSASGTIKRALSKLCPLPTSC